MKLTLLLALSASVLLGQNAEIQAQDDPRIPHYRTLYNPTSVDTNGVALTVQGNGSQTPVVFERAEIYCVAAGTITTIIYATAASATAGTVIGPLNLFANGASSVVNPSVFTASNFTGGTTTGTFPCAAGETVKLNMSPLYIGNRANSASNVTVKVAAVTGTTDFQIRLQWRSAVVQ